MCSSLWIVLLKESILRYRSRFRRFQSYLFSDHRLNFGIIRISLNENADEFSWFQNFTLFLQSSNYLWLQIITVKTLFKFSWHQSIHTYYFPGHPLLPLEFIVAKAASVFITLPLDTFTKLFKFFKAPKIFVLITSTVRVYAARRCNCFLFFSFASLFSSFLFAIL